MKRFQIPFLFAALTAFNLAAVNHLQAQGKLDDINVINVTLKLQLQSPGINSQNGKTRTYDKPVNQTINTKNLLARLAQDKQMQGLYDKNSFPDGSKLALFGTNQVIVVKGNNEFIIDVSDIVSFTSGNNDIVSGTLDTSTGLARPNITELILVNLNFDDTFIVGGSDLSFSLRGLDTVKTNDSVPNSSSGKYNEKTSDKIKDAAGEGQSGGIPFVVTGSIDGNRNTALVYTPPVPGTVN